MKHAIKGAGARRFGPAEGRPAPAAAASTLRIGSVEVPGRWLLAPLAGVSDWPFRVLALAEGASLAYTEMVSSEGLVRQGKATLRYLTRREEERPFAVQLFGADPETMARAAQIAVEHGADLIDVNMGCPVKKVCRTGAGAALMQTPGRVEAIVKAMARAVSVPVQVKLRSGWDADSVNVVEVATAARDGGAAAVTVHGRTRAQGYEGLADWDVIARVKQALPELVVIGNGDVRSAPDALQRIERYGVDAVMIGRAACGYPWIFGEVAALARGAPLPPPPSYERWRAVIDAHFENLVAYRRSEARAVREFRKHLVWYSRGRPGAGAFRAELFGLTTIDEVRACLDRHFPPERHHEMDREAEVDAGSTDRAWG